MALILFNLYLFAIFWAIIIHLIMQKWDKLNLLLYYFL